MTISIPDFCLVVLVGASGAGKSTFARQHFQATEIVSSDHYRAVVDDDESSQEASIDAFALVHTIAGLRLKRRKLTVIDATSVRADARAPLIALARQYHTDAVAIVLDPGERTCRERNAARPHRQVEAGIIKDQIGHLQRGKSGLEREGFRHVHVLERDAIDAAVIRRTAVPGDLRHEVGPFDIIGDVHGCGDELERLLEQLGYAVTWGTGPAGRTVAVRAPAGRRAVFVGDLVDRGPRTPDVLRLVMAMVADGSALCVAGNHDAKLLRWLKGHDVQQTHGLAESIAQLNGETPAFRQRAKDFLDQLGSHLWLEGGKLVVAHAGIRADMIGRVGGAVRSFCLFGQTTGELDAHGLPVRLNWAADYEGEAEIVYGHTPVPMPLSLNGTINIDTGCCFGGGLTAYRWPEREIITVPAIRQYTVPRRPFVLASEPPGGPDQPPGAPST